MPTKTTSDERMDEWRRRQERAEAFVRDCFYLMGQPHDAANLLKVRTIAQKVLRAVNNEDARLHPPEATNAMIKAGARAVRAFDPRVCDAEDLAASVYQAMEEARRS